MAETANDPTRKLILETADPTRKRYLGDSVYVETENGMLRLTTDNGYDNDPRNIIWLEEGTLAALLDYIGSSPTIKR